MLMIKLQIIPTASIVFLLIRTKSGQFGPRGISVLLNSNKLTSWWGGGRGGVGDGAEVTRSFVSRTSCRTNTL